MAVLKQTISVLSMSVLCALSTISNHAFSNNQSVVASAETPQEIAKHRAEYIRKNYVKYEYQISMRDGVKLYNTVYVPLDAQFGKRYPILLHRTPYGSGPYGLDAYRGQLGPSFDYEKDGFIFVFSDVRGRHMSEGEFSHMRPHNPNKRSSKDIDESSDTYDTIDWLIKNIAGHNGKVGLWGNSYPGFYSSAGSIDNHPALVASSPQAPIADWFIGDDMHRNGALTLNMAFGFLYAVDQIRPAPTPNGNWSPFPFGTPDGYQFFLNLGSLANVNQKYFKDRVPFWNEIVAHPNYDSFWQSRNILPHLKNIKTAMLTVGGWFDTEDLYGPLQTFAAIEKNNPGIENHLVMGPWIHGGWNRTDGDKVGDANFGYRTIEPYQKISFEFFRHHLKGGTNPNLPKAWVFETGANRWRAFPSWPPKEAKEQALYLHSDGQLRFDRPQKTEYSFIEYLSDPSKPVPYTSEIMTRWSSNYMGADQRFVSTRPDVVTWQSEVLKEDTTLAGPLKADLFVSTTGTDADFIVKLVDVAPMDSPTPNDTVANRGNQQTLVRGEIFRARYRDSFEHPKAMVSGEVTPIRYTLNDVFHTFKRGHRIQIQIHSTWFPLFDRNPQTYVPSIYAAKDSDFIKATHRIYVSPENPSSIKIRILK